MSKERVWSKRWIIWWIYGNGNQLVQCKCVQDKMKFRMGENTRGEFWEIQIHKLQRLSSKIFKTFYKSKTIIISILTVIYPKETIFITVIYHSLSYYPRIRRYYRHCIFLSPSRRILASIAKSKVFIRISEIIEEEFFIKNSVFKASQRLINTIHQIKYQFITDIRIIRMNENNNW